MAQKQTEQGQAIKVDSLLHLLIASGIAAAHRFLSLVTVRWEAEVRKWAERWMSWSENGRTGLGTSIRPGDADLTVRPDSLKFRPDKGTIYIHAETFPAGPNLALAAIG